MIEFAQPQALWALLSIPLIIALHVLRPRRRTLTVSSTSLWVEALRERQRGLGMQQLFRNLSLLLLCLAALVASLALAAPRWLTATGDNRDIVLVLDVSASMGARSGSTTRLEEARSAARELLAQMPQGTRALIMTSAAKAVLRTGFESNAQRLTSAIDAIKGTDEAGDPRQALSLATSLLRTRPDATIWFITDAAFDSDLGIAGERVHYRTVGEAARNVAITRFDFRPEAGREDRFQVLLSIRNYTDRALVVPASIELERRKLFAREIELAAGATRTLVLPFAGKAVGRATARIDVNDDLASDNAAFAVANIVNATHVLLITPGNFYLQSVLGALPNVVLTLADDARVADLARAARRHDVVIVDRVAVPPLPPGNFMLIGTLPADFNVRSSDTIAKPSIVGSGDSALVQGIDLSAVRIDEALDVAPLPPGEPGESSVQRLFWSPRGELALALLDQDKRVVLLGFDLMRSNFALQAAFPLFITRSLDWLDPRGPPRERTQINTGQVYPITLGANSAELIMRTPDGEGEALVANNGTVNYERTSTAGIYRYSIDNVVGYFAANLTDADESDLSARALLNTPAQTPPDGDAAGTAAQIVTAMWPQLVALLLALMIGEWLLWCLGRRHA